MLVSGEVLVRISILEGGVGNDGTANIVNSQLAVSGATGVGACRASARGSSSKCLYGPRDTVLVAVNHRY